ncbi:hypothetical protein ALC60_06965 [Trachymyrmex zeteki]|uniref:Uncharacterized protein n=1 Tax=Mycetomoellerius zeteki TaxID=64791 RepID=A0A151X1E0_9HYME|nr:hypothetical protein ALC60_06965 [Trachymyrmex zeteki]
MSIRALVLEFKRNLSPGSRDQRLDSRRTERNMQICTQNILHRIRFSLFAAAAAARTSTTLKPLLSY